MTTDRKQIIAAYLQVSDGREWAINGVGEPVPAFYAIAFAAGAASRDTEIAGLVAALELRRDWFETQAKVVSKGGPSSWELMLLRDERDACDAALAKVRKPT